MTHYIWVLIILLIESSCGYKNIRLQDYLCADKFFIALQKPFRGDPAFTLLEDRESAAIITQVWNSTFSGELFPNSKLKHDCYFRVRTPDRPPRGIYTIITRLKFRHDPETGGCLDYIQFSNGNRPPSERICNDISIDGPGGRLIFDQRDRNVYVYIHISKKRAIMEPLELRMVLTAHSECKYTGDFLCEPSDKYSCISRHFVRDNITNCMHPCRDEISCLHDAILAEEIDTANVAISAITSLIFTMLGVGLCVYICWKYWNCITVQQRAREASASVAAMATSIAEYQQRLQQRGDVPTVDLPTPLAFDNIQAHYQTHLQQRQEQQYLEHSEQPQTPKDLPPSYESLFPDR